MPSRYLALAGKPVIIITVVVISLIMINDQ